MEPTLVIKVQYGDILRRFNARVNENENLDLDMLGLRAKIFGLFDFPADADVTLTYVDEDGDVVTLVDDEDLRDVMRQQLKFLKISVTVNSERSSRSYARSSGSSTPLRSSSAQPPIYPNINAIIVESLKSMPESIREALSKVSGDLLSNATSLGPSIADLVGQLAKMGLDHPILNQQAPVRTSPSNCPTAPNTSAAKEANIPPDSLPKAAYGSCSGKSPVADSVAAATDGRPPVTSDEHPIDLNAIPPVFSNISSSMKEYQNESKTVDLSKTDGKCDAPLSSSAPAQTTALPMRNPTHTMGFTGNLSACPFSGLPLANDANMPPRAMHRCKRGWKQNDVAVGGVFHRGIRCDGCGVHPITGPRYKSLVKDDYDLCSICFAEMGREGDYVRMDKPLSYRTARGGRPFPVHQPRVPPLPTPLAFPHRHGVKRSQPKLDSRFVSDVTIMDGTAMAPSTPFTKIWRMRNNGNFVWIPGTRLVWIGGDRFCEKESVEIVIPLAGIPIDEELDIAVDFVAPSAPGRYISYWRMASPSSHKFGQRVWVLIQVDASVGDSGNKMPGTLNLNLPPESTSGIILEGGMGSRFVGGVNDFFMPSSSTPATETVKPSAEDQQGGDQEQNFPINDALFVGNVASASAPAESSSSVSYPVIEPADMAVLAAVLAPETGPISAPATPAEVAMENATTESDVVEENLLKELAEMGFKQVDLNKEVLRMNSYDLQQSVDDLCGVTDWDPILEELEEMGFSDKEMNVRLLKKNDGSIRRVVMELLTGEKA